MPTHRLTQWAPLFRAPPAASQWRNLPAPAVCRFSSSNAPPGKRKQPRRTQGGGPPAAASIFDQLFPQPAQPRTSPAPSSSGSRDGMLSVARGVSSKDASPGRGGAAVLKRRSEVEKEKGDEEDVTRSAGTTGKRYVLVVRNGSRSTLPSDFYRIAPQGAVHLDGRGWSSMQAVQARHTITIEPQDKYLLHFSSLAEATAYKAELERLLAAAPHPEEARGEEHQQQPPRLTLSTPDPSLVSVELVQGLSALRQVTGARVPMNVLRSGLHARNLVHVKLDGSQLTPHELRALVAADGRERNLAWKLSGSWGEDGVSVTLKNEPPPKRAAPDEKGEGEAAPGGGGPDPALASEGRGGEAKKTREAFFSRFFLSFDTVHDARRFIRSWHRRKVNVDDRERACIVNTSLIW